MPSRTGVYYIHNDNGNLIYIGKSRNIKKRVNQHFTGNTTICKRIQNEVFDVTYEETGSELIALLKESEEIKIHKPTLNRSQRKSIFQLALYAEKDKNDYLNLKIQKFDGRKKEITLFSSLQDAKNTLLDITTKYQLCQKLTGLYQTKKECFQYNVQECDGACISKISAEDYNQRVYSFLEEWNYKTQNMIVIDKGRNISERSAVLVENGIYKGYAFYELNYQITNPTILHNILTVMQNNRDAKNIIQSYIRKSKTVKVINF
jgi:DNA polymerase III subunit epsilon